MSLSDLKILNNNRLKILHRVLEGYKFSPKEVNDIEENYFNNKENYHNKNNYLRRTESSDRERLLADIYEATEIENLIKVNDFMNLKIKDPDKDLMIILNILGISQS